ncbi:MAG: BrnA antitoxin family protein [Pseudomonadota bacterium]
MGQVTGRRQAEHQGDMIRAMRAFEWDMHSAITRAGRLPAEWREIWEARSAKKERVTLRVDADVVRFFKSMGDGYGPRMNAVLRSFMQARLAGLIDGEDLAETYRARWMGTARPSPATEAQQEAERADDWAEWQKLMDKLSANRDAFSSGDMARLDYLNMKISDRARAEKGSFEDVAGSADG